MTDTTALDVYDAACLAGLSARDYAGSWNDGSRLASSPAKARS